MRLLLFFLIFLFNFNPECNAQELTGKWIGEYLIEVSTNHNEDISTKDTITHSTEMERSDTRYDINPAIFEILPNGKFYSNFSEGRWTFKNGVISFKTDTVEFIGRLKNSQLSIELEHANEKFILCYQKLSNPDAHEISKNELINKFWKFKKKDSLIVSYHFLDTARVILNNKYGSNLGYWDQLFYGGVFCLYISSPSTSQVYTHYMGDFKSGKSVSIHSYISTFYKPDLFNTEFQIAPFLSKKKHRVLKLRLIGSWSGSWDFHLNPYEFEEEELENLSFELELQENDFKISYGGTGVESNRKYEKTVVGQWSLSPTGDYITLKYIFKINNRELESEQYVALSEISKNRMTIQYDYHSLTCERGIISGTKVNLKRK